MIIQTGLLDKEIDIGKLKDIQARQHFKILHAQGNVPTLATGGMLSVIVNVSNEGDFLLKGFTGSFTTLSHPAAADVDDGVDHLRMKIRDVGLGVDLFDDYIPLHCILSPGRRRAAGILVAPGALTVADSSQLYMVMAMQHVFPANSNIQLDVKNDSNVINSFEMELVGLVVRSPATVKGIRR